jgi:hypothetical protein
VKFAAVTGLQMGLIVALIVLRVILFAVHGS